MVTNGSSICRHLPITLPAMVLQNEWLRLRAGHESGLLLEQSLVSFLWRYCTTPHATMGVIPCLLFMGCNLRTHLHLLTPDVGAHVRNNQTQQKGYHVRHSRTRELCIGQPVWARNFRDSPGWVSAVVLDRVGPVSYVPCATEEWRLVASSC